MTNRSSATRAPKLSNPTNVAGVSRSQSVRLMPNDARIGPAESSVRPMRVGARNSSAHQPSPTRGPRRRRGAAAPSRIGTAIGDLLAGEDGVELRDHRREGVLRGLVGGGEDVRVELLL